MSASHDESRELLTYNEIRIEFVSDRHDHLLECEDVIRIGHTLIPEREIDVADTKISTTQPPSDRSDDSQSPTQPSPSHLQSTFRTSRIEDLIVSMNRNVENIRIVVENFLRSITCKSTRSATSQPSSLVTDHDEHP